ncbi:MAG: hypothetical protein ACKPE2_15680, partial [Dolichospermum sp.]
IPESTATLSRDFTITKHTLSVLISGIETPSKGSSPFSGTSIEHISRLKDFINFQPRAFKRKPFLAHNIVHSGIPLIGNFDIGNIRAARDDCVENIIIDRADDLNNILR